RGPPGGRRRPWRPRRGPAAPAADSIARSAPAACAPPRHPATTARRRRNRPRRPVQSARRAAAPPTASTSSPRTARINGLAGAGLYGPGMDYLAHLRQELAAFEDCLDGDLSAPVEHCGDWTLYDLASHLGGGNLWAAAAVTEQRGDFEAAPAPRDPAALAAWLSETGAVLLAALDTEPDTPA